MVDDFFIVENLDSFCFYGSFPIKTMTESQCVAELFKLYQQLTK
jgi:hypothetical protein